MSLCVCTFFGLVLIAFEQVSTEMAKLANSDLVKLQRTWKLTYSETGGKGFKPTNDIKISFERKVATAWSAGELSGKQSIAIDAIKVPKTMDMTVLESRLFPENKGRTNPMIYELDGDHLKLCFGSNFFPRRPTDFSTKEGDGRCVHIYERVKPLKDAGK